MTTPSPAAPHHRFHADALADRPSATGRGRVLGLDGLRAVAVLLVLGFHFGVGGLGGGFFGVDVFYVLSGFLITGLLLAEYERRDRIGLGAFWLRRARRLLPALLLVLVAVTLMVRFAEPAGTYPGYRGAALSALFYVSNWWQVATSGNYFVATGATSPLTHTWSLAVEEQFYLVWPLVVLAVLHLAGSFRRGVRAVLAVAAVGAMASAVEMAVLFRPGGNTTRIYFGTDTHAQSVLVGAVLACLLTLVARRRGVGGMAPVAPAGAPRIVLTLAGLAGVLVVFVAARRLNGASTDTYRGGFLLVALCSAAAIAAVVSVPAARWPGCCRAPPWCGWAPCPTASISGTSRWPSTSTPAGRDCTVRPCWRCGSIIVKVKDAEKILPVSRQSSAIVLKSDGSVAAFLRIFNASRYAHVHPGIDLSFDKFDSCPDAPLERILAERGGVPLLRSK